MKCKEFKFFLLGCENPDQPPAEVKAHLASCADCQDWQNHLALIEMNVPFLPVPASVARADLLRRILSQPGLSKTKETGKFEDKKLKLETPLASTETEQRHARQGYGILSFFRTMEPSARRFAVGGAAAAILLVIFGYLVIRTPHRPGTIAQTPRQARDSLVANILQRDLRLAEAENATERFMALADLADDFSSEVKTLAPLPDAKEVLDDMVNKYEKVVNTGLLEVAKELQHLPAEERDDLFNKIGERLQVAGRTVDELGDKLSSKIPNSSRQALSRLTNAAKSGDEKLRALRSEASRPQPRDVNRPESGVLVRGEIP